MPRKNQPVLMETPVTEISQDRRSKRRYPIALPVQYKIMKNYLVIGTGSGSSIDLSSGGIAFAASEPLRVGSYLELSISWPVLLNHSCPLQLVAAGRVVRSDAGCTAMRLDRYEFRTQRANAFQAASPQPAVAMCFR